MNQVMTVTRLGKFLICIVLAGFLFWLEHNYSVNKFSTLVQIEYDVKSEGVGQLFWVTNNSSYDELNSTKFRLIEKNGYYAVFIPALELIKSIRFDPTNKSSQVIIKSIVFKENDQIQRFDSPEKLKALLKPINNSVSLIIEQGNLRMIPHSSDPQLNINVDHLQINSNQFWKRVFIMLMVLPVWIVLTKLGEMVVTFFTKLRCEDQRERLIVYIEIVLSIIVAVIVLTYVYNCRLK